MPCRCCVRRSPTTACTRRVRCSMTHASADGARGGKFGRKLSAEASSCPGSAASEDRRLRYFPLFFNLRKQKVLVVGGGEVALRKVDLLERAGALVTVVAPRVEPEIARGAA